MKEIFDSLMSSINSRLRNPFIGAFILSWLAWNWYDLALLFWGSGDIETRLSNFNVPLMDKLILWGFFPGVSALVYVWVMPHVSNLIQGIQSAPLKAQKLARLRDRREIAKEETAALKAELPNEIKELKNEIEKLTIERDEVANSLLDLTGTHQDIKVLEVPPDTSMNLLFQNLVPDYTKWSNDVNRFLKFPKYLRDGVKVDYKSGQQESYTRPIHTNDKHDKRVLVKCNSSFEGKSLSSFLNTAAQKKYKFQVITDDEVEEIGFRETIFDIPATIEMRGPLPDLSRLANIPNISGITESVNKKDSE